MLRLVRNDMPPAWSLADMLMVVHDRWLVQLRYLVGPALAPDTEPASRQKAVRRLQREMKHWYGEERELPRSLAPLLSSEPERRLQRAEQAIDRLQKELERLMPDSAPPADPELAGPVREMVLDLLDALQLWCAELELAASELPLDRLNDDSRAILARLSQFTHRLS